MDTSLLPVISSNKEQSPIKEYGSKTFHMNFEKKRIDGFLDHIEALKQGIFCMINTERLEHLIYSFDYGFESRAVSKESFDDSVMECQKCVEEALLQDDRVLEVKNFDFKKQQDGLSCTFEVSTIYGNYEEEVKINGN